MLKSIVMKKNLNTFLLDMFKDFRITKKIFSAYKNLKKRYS